MLYRIAKNFEFHEFQAIRENIIHECLVFVDKDRSIALIREIYLQNALSRTFAKVFSGENLPLYGMLHLLSSHNVHVHHKNKTCARLL